MYNFMNQELKRKIKELNQNFDKVHYVEKRKRSLETLYKILIYNSKKYKERINALQDQYTKNNQRKTKIPFDELVACTIAAKCIKNGVFGTSHQILKKYNKKVVIALSKNGKIGEVSNLKGTNNIVGKCAEVKAANSILSKDKTATINEIEFTNAIRPRTQEHLKRCNNCVAIFGNE